MATVSVLYISSVLLHLLFIYTVYGTVCPQNELEVQCATDCSSNIDSCPTKPRQTQNDCSTIRPNTCSTSTCKCRFNYSRAKNGTCIPTADCPPFRCRGPHEEYNPCPPACPTDDCSQATPTGKCPIVGRIGIVVPCRPDCRCKKNYWRKNGTCVPYARCNKNISSVSIASKFYENFLLILTLIYNSTISYF